MATNSPLHAPRLGEPSVASRNDRASDLLEKGFKRYFWKSLFGTRLDGLAI
jgi:D-alanyl-D-alanine carboxypeptidase